MLKRPEFPSPILGVKSIFLSRREGIVNRKSGKGKGFVQFSKSKGSVKIFPNIKTIYRNLERWMHHRFINTESGQRYVQLFDYGRTHFGKTSPSVVKVVRFGYIYLYFILYLPYLYLPLPSIAKRRYFPPPHCECYLPLCLPVKW
jgi:hypothetical protein